MMASILVKSDDRESMKPPPLCHEDSSSSSATLISVTSVNIIFDVPKPHQDKPSEPPSSSQQHSINQPPPLPYSLHTRKRGIIIAFTSLLLGACACPILLYFLLTRFTNLSRPLVFTTITTVPILQLWEFCHRTWLLIRPSPESRPLNSPRWALDFYHWNYVIGVIVITCCFSIGSGTGNLFLVGFPLPYLMTVTGATMCVAQILVQRGVKAPFRLSSLPRGAKLRPPVFFIVEDIVAVNGGGGLEFRRAWGERFEASAVMRRLLGQMAWFWGVPALVLGTVLIVLLATINKEVAYGLSWSVPWVWAGLWAWLTIRWVKKGLEEERTAFANGQA